MPQVPPPRWSEEQFAVEANEAIDYFRQTRLVEPLEIYLDYFDQYRGATEEIIEETVDLAELRVQAAELLTSADNLTIVRYLAGPPVSEDDLKVISETDSLAKGRIMHDPSIAERVVDTVMIGLDRRRFPWVHEDRDPSSAERESAVIGTAALIANQKMQTARRNQAKKEQEGAVAEVLDEHRFTQVSTRAIQNISHFPEPGEYCRESYFGGRKADLIVRLWDGRVMPIECKVSNSSTNSVKRLNNDAAAKAKTWLDVFGTATVVPAAVLSGVFKVHNLRDAQASGLTIFWAHRLDEMISFIERSRP
ncbi:XamI family restriction endonuclease [Microbacterium gorillae]|uniref:XamI family restriction endonuclease n=1 Tax=Microbacterium gorillae TaxID=1231063 RepID=UPI003D9655F9